MSDRDMAIDGRRHSGASSGLQGRTTTGVQSPVVVAHVSARITGSESLPRRPDVGRLAPADPSAMEVGGVPDQSRPVIACGEDEWTGAQC